MEFVPSSFYQSTITESQAAVFGTPVVTLGFNRGLKESERQTLGFVQCGEYNKFSLNNETFVITVKAPLSIGTVTVFVFVRYIDSGGTEQQIYAIVTINIIDDGKVYFRHTHAYIHICKNKHTYIHAYIHTYLHTYIHTDTHTHIHACIHTNIHTNIHTYIHNYN